MTKSFAIWGYMRDAVLSAGASPMMGIMMHLTMGACPMWNVVGCWAFTPDLSKLFL